MELVLGLAALFLFCFGSQIIMLCLGFGFQMSDRLMVSLGLGVKLLFKNLFKGLVLAIRWTLHRISKPQPEEWTIRSVITTPAELQHMRNQHFLQSRQRTPVVIEYSQPKRK